MIPLIALFIAITFSGPISWIAWGYVALCAIGAVHCFQIGAMRAKGFR